MSLTLTLILEFIPLLTIYLPALFCLILLVNFAFASWKILTIVKSIKLKRQVAFGQQAYLEQNVMERQQDSTSIRTSYL